MYQYTPFDKQFVQLRATQYRDQLTRWQAGDLSEDAFKPLRLQNGWYVQRFAPMLRVAVPYGELSSPQLRALATIARDYDHKDLTAMDTSNAGLSDVAMLPDQRFIYRQFIVKKNYTFFESIYACHLSLVLQNDLKIQKPPVVTLEARQSLRCVAKGGASR